MSYARFTEPFVVRKRSDVYIFCTGQYFECQICKLLEWPHSYETRFYSKIIRHVRAHLRAGHAVPPRCLKTLLDEQKKRRA